MLHRLRRHPFAVKAHFDFSLVLTYAFPKAILEPLLPPGLELDTFGEYGFVAAAMVKTEKLRPAFFPAFLGKDFFLCGYRIFVNYRTQKGKRHRGLFILRSDTNNNLMQRAGNLLTHYQYHPIKAEWQKTKQHICVKTVSADGKSNALVAVKYGSENSPLPATSVFASWKEARRFAGPMPFTFDYEKQTHSIISVKGVREDWLPQVVEVEKAEFGFLKQAIFQGAEPKLSNAFLVEQVPYRWEKGEREKL